MAICRNISILCLVALCKLSIACGPADQDKREKQEIFDRPEFTLLGPAEYYFVADTECQENEAKAATSISEITQFYADQDGSQSRVIQPIGFKSFETLTTPAVKQTFFGGVYEADCRAKQVENCQSAYLNITSWKVVESRKPLKVCKPKAHYKRFSFEGMALTVAQNINQAAQAAMQYADLKLPPVVLEVNPNFRVRKTQTSNDGVVQDALLYATRQMSYFSKSQSIAIYPERPEQSQDKPQFWESEFVASHEFGHHVEAEIRRKTSGAKDETKTIVGQIPSKEKALVNKAVSEAFADLIAFYSLEQDPRALSEFPQAFLDRNPSQPIFSDSQTVKVLDTKIMKAFTSQKRIRNRNIVDLTRLHLIGAIAAHGLHKIFTQLAAANSGDIDSVEQPRLKQKYRLAVEWFEIYSTLRGKKDSSKKEPFVLLAQSIEQLLAQADTDTESLAKLQQTFSTNLPGLKALL